MSKKSPVTAAKTTAAAKPRAKRAPLTPLETSRKFMFEQAESMLGYAPARLVLAFMAVSIEIDDLTELLGLLYSGGMETTLAQLEQLRGAAHYVASTSSTTNRDNNTRQLTTEQAIAEVGRVSSIVRGMRAIVEEDKVRATASRKPRRLHLVATLEGSPRAASTMGAAS